MLSLLDILIINGVETLLKFKHKTNFYLIVHSIKVILIIMVFQPK